MAIHVRIISLEIAREIKAKSVAVEEANQAADHVVDVTLAAAPNQYVLVNLYREQVAIHTAPTTTSVWFALNALHALALAIHVCIISLEIARQIKAKSVAVEEANQAADPVVYVTLAAAPNQYVLVNCYRFKTSYSTRKR